LSHSDFAERYAKICKKDVASSSEKGTCEAIVKAMKLKAENIRIGKTRVLYRAMEYRRLELEWEIITKNERFVHLSSSQDSSPLLSSPFLFERPHQTPTTPLIVLTDVFLLSFPCSIITALENIMALDHESMDDEEKEDYIIRLADAVREADLFRINTKSAEKGRALLEHFVEERMDAKVKRQLETARDQKSLPKLLDALEICEREGFVTKLVRECRQLCEEIEDCEAALTFAVRCGALCWALVLVDPGAPLISIAFWIRILSM
jgi:hypothetical protein